jgi:adenosylcobinamide-GDP ribazoletransferase
MTSPLRAMRAAFVFLTRIPVGGFPYDSEEWRWAPAFFPLVGAVVGGITASLFEALRPLGGLGAATLALGTSLLITGAFHEDGFADTSDALGGGYDRAKVFVILKDSRIGAFGACAVVVSIVGRAVLLAHAETRAVAALVLVSAFARATPVWQMAVLPYATPDGSKSRGVARAGTVQAGVASAWPLLIAAAFVHSGGVDPRRAVAVAIAMIVIALVTGWRYRARAGGVTGDFLGATEQLCELAGLAVMAWGS